MLNVFIGYDEREAVAYHVLAHSILANASKPVAITPLVRSQLPITRPRTGSTDFSDTRFLVPYLMNFEGIAIFMDCDMLCLEDIWSLPDAGKAVSVRKHDQKIRGDTKFLGEPQYQYPRKNWSSLMVMDCSQCNVLTPEYVDEMPLEHLHRFQWLKDEDIGEIPSGWNDLVGYQDVSESKLLQWTEGGPYFPEYRHEDRADDWFAAKSAMLNVRSNNPLPVSSPEIDVEIPPNPVAAPSLRL